MSDIYRKTALFSAVTAFLYVLFFCFLDRPVDLWVHLSLQGSWLEMAGKNISLLATGAYVKLALAVVLVCIFAVDPAITRPGTKKLLFICLSISAAIVIGEGFKYLLGRYRPVMLFNEHLYGLHYLSTKWEMNSTPSGHTYRAFAFFTALSLLFRRYTLLFFFMAILIGISRVVVTAHYPSDVLFGAFIGVISATWMHTVLFNRPD